MWTLFVGESVNVTETVRVVSCLFMLMKEDVVLCPAVLWLLLNWWCLVLCVRTEFFRLILMSTPVGLLSLLSLLCPALGWLLVMLKCVLTSCGKETLLSKIQVFSVRNQWFFVVSNFSLTFLRTLTVQLSTKWQLGLGKDGKGRVPAAVRGTKANGTNSARKWMMESVDSRELKEARASWMSKLEESLNSCLSRTHVERKWRQDDWARLQVGKETSLCFDWRIDMLPPTPVSWRGVWGLGG